MGGDAGDERFFELSLDLLASAGFDGYLKRINPAWERLLGWTVAELKARPYIEFVHPDDRERTAQEAARLVDPEVETRDFELRFATSDGGWRWLLFSAQGDVEAQQLLAVGKDITDRKRAEGHRASQTAIANLLVESAPLEAVMPRLLCLIGEMAGWDGGEFWALDPDADALRAHGRDTVAERGAGLPGRALMRARPTWETGPEGGIALPILSEGGQVLGVLAFSAPDLAEPGEELLGALRTITDQVGQYLRRKQAEEALAGTAAELRRRANELERSNAELEQFAYVASHDLSEPLRMVSGFVQLLSERYRGRLDSDADEFIDYIVDGVARMQSLIDDLLAYSRVGRATEDENVDLDVVLGGVRSALVAPIAQSQAVIEADPLPVVYGDPRELSQLLQNLLSNAMKFVDSEAPQIRLSAQ